VCVALIWFAGGGSAAAQSVPTPDPLPAQQNIFYGETPPGGNRAPVLVFVHGVNARASDWWLPKNDMYNRAFSAGYRTAFIGLNVDGTPDIDALQPNIAVLQEALPAVSAHFDDSRIYIIAHSKGGLDVQGALLDPLIASRVKAVFTLGTPNQGTELADWAFGPGQAAATSLGLLNAAVASMRTATIAELRPKVDAALGAFGVPFYTISGSSFTTPTNPLTSATGPVLTALTGGHPNDGVVTVARTKILATYATDLGTIPVNHFGLAAGSIVFPRINAQISALEDTRDFRRIAADGFTSDGEGQPLGGSTYNSFPWSMRWFKGKLYVGTNRASTCSSLATADAATGTSSYQSANPLLGCTPDPKDLPLQAEIWRYTPETGVWERVYQSPLDVPLEFDVAGNPTKFTARDIGYRDMIVFRENAGRSGTRGKSGNAPAHGRERLYVAGVGASSLFDTLPAYLGDPARPYPPPRILWTEDGITWNDVPQEPGTFLGDIGKNTGVGLVKQRGFRSFATMRTPDGVNQLYVTLTDLKGIGFILMSTRPSIGNNAWRPVSPTAEEVPVYTIHEYRNQIYATATIGGVNSPNGYGVFRTDGITPDPVDPTRLLFTPVALPAGTLEFPPRASVSMEVFNGSLYVGSDRPTELIRINPDDSWDLLVGPPRMTTAGYKQPLSGIGLGFNSFFNGHFHTMAAHDGALYLGTWDWSESLRGTSLEGFVRQQYGFDLFKSTDGVSWTVVSRNGIDDPTSFDARNMVSTPFGLMVGAANQWYGLQVYQTSGILDLNRDGVVDVADVTLIRTKPAAAADNDPRDVNRDGRLTVKDARLLATQCTNLDCAPNAWPSVRPPDSLVKVSQDPATSTITLSWTAVPGAVRYHVFRADPTMLDDLLPPSMPITLPGGLVVTIEQIKNGILDLTCEGNVDETSLCAAIQALQVDTIMTKPPRWVGTTTTPTWTGVGIPAAGQALYHVAAEDAAGHISAPSNVVPSP
jgi:hypothetical protein